MLGHQKLVYDDDTRLKEVFSMLRADRVMIISFKWGSINQLYLNHLSEV